MIELSNDQLTVSIKESGAEVCSVKSKATGVEYMWQADPSYWGRHAPVLFPIVGQVMGGEYSYRGGMYKLSQHGFARDQVFEIAHQSVSSVRLRLTASQETKSVYPVAFELMITYTLKDSQVDCSYEVVNKENEPMHFSLGLHPGFTCPLAEGTSFEDYELVFSQNETLDRHLLDGPFLSGEVISNYLDNTASIPLSHDLFKDDALIFENFKSESIRLQSPKTEHFVEMGLSGFPLIGLWSKPDSGAPYVCIEPWYGVADEVDRKAFEKKKGMQVLAGNSSWKADTYITVG
jgi:galactose mutarotase-like enzyme